MNNKNKPDIGTKIVVMYRENQYKAVVDSDVDYDFFHVKFTDRQPADDHDHLVATGGWYLNMRGDGKDWKRCDF